MSRRLAREKAMQVMFQIDVGKIDKDLAVQYIVEENGLSAKDKDYIYSIVNGICSSLEEIDDYIKKFALNWNLDRLANVDRNVLRIAIYEMKYLSDEIPYTVSINEAVELAKKFSTEESSKYVNGVLDRFMKQLKQETGE